MLQSLVEDADESLMIFLIEYDRSHAELANIRTFDDADRKTAEDERLQRELELHRAGVQRDVVLLQAASEAALRETHERYFYDLPTLIQRLQEKLSA